jgi:6-phosphogluconolactonase
MGMMALTFTMGCPGFFVYPGSLNGGGGSTGDYVYVANANSTSNSTTETISAYTVGTGTLTAVTNSPYVLSFLPTAIAVNPANTIVFVAGNSAIYAFAIESGGVLNVLNSGSAVGAADVVSMDISPDGQWLFALDGNGVTLDEFQINSSTGVLTPQAGAAYTVSGNPIPVIVPHAVKVAPRGDLVFVALGTGGDLVFPFNTSTGALSTQLSLPPVSVTTSDNALAVNPAETLLFIARSGTSGGLAVYTIGSGGSLSEINNSPFAAGNQPFSVVVNKAGTDVYVANQLDSTISGYSIASGGALTALSGSPYSSGASVTALTIDNSGNYLLAAAHGGGADLTMYSFDSTTAGKLDPSTTTATGTDPTGPVAIAATH